MSWPLSIQTASEQGGLVLLVGDSSVGKTRCAYEAVRAVVPQWWLLQPADVEQVDRAAAAVPARLVVWLDELHRYLGGPAGLRAGTVRTLLDAGAVLVATLWPDRYIAYTTQPIPGRDDPYAVEREVLGLASVVGLASSFSDAEYERARAAAQCGDRRIALALESTDYGLTQVIAAAPQLIERWHSADPYALAVLNAAIDITRLGVRSPLGADLLRDAAPGYCNPRQRADAPPNWFEAALAYSSQRLRGAAAALAPIGTSNTMGQISGYLVADYLQQYAEGQRRATKVPASTWQSLCEHLTDPGDQVRAAMAARNRLLYRYAEPLLQNAADGGNKHAALLLADLLLRQGRTEEGLTLLRAQVDAGDLYAQIRLVDWLVEQSGVEELRARADAGDEYAVDRLVDLLVEQGREEELRAWANAGERHVLRRLVDLLVEQGREEELRAWANAGEHYAHRRLVDLLKEQGREEDLHARANAGDWYAAERLAELLVEQGRVEELHARANAGDVVAVLRLLSPLVEHGGAAELHTGTAADEVLASIRLVNLLAEQGRDEELHARANAGDVVAAVRLHMLLVEQERRAQMRLRVTNEKILAQVRLLNLLVEQGPEARLRVRPDLADLADLANLTGERLVGLEGKQDQEDELRAAFNADLERTAHLLVEQGRVEELRARADVGDWHAADRLAELLVEQGRVEELRARVDAGDWHAAEQLVGFLMEQGQEAGEQLRRYGLSAEE
ncbi:hypothetical protein OHA25_31985 [Nonomuraea sp. NBC_00507]|uniref:hypothetical protein n=1 Tax=Nonomuraea sp. NBC_00507 TaxID=2976002 RepID=UPI002E17BC53